MWHNRLRYEFHSTSTPCFIHFGMCYSFYNIAYRGQSDKRTEAFRAQYSCIGEFRTTAPNVTYIAMTATATSSAQEKIVSLLQMNSYATIRQSPDKHNIRYDTRNYMPLPNDNCMKYLNSKKYVTYLHMQLFGCETCRTIFSDTHYFFYCRAPKL